jgi:hypothetical protein
MQRRARFRPVRDDPHLSENREAVVFLLEGLVLFASGLVLLISCAADLASPASAAGGGNAPLEMRDQRALPVLSLHGLISRVRRARGPRGATGPVSVRTSGRRLPPGESRPPLRGSGPRDAPLGSLAPMLRVARRRRICAATSRRWRPRTGVRGSSTSARAEQARDTVDRVIQDRARRARSWIPDMRPESGLRSRPGRVHRTGV